ncbi:hypothetical protein NADFUDRAFT_83788 [Nadsonia fulvescens var. elongata DSM 6958]|uniref:Xylanolytic transcriptional activator regulatory domain-containing protein n=1 Tax=Nadsonia fulvescens var. elongata DSM 6958 TaxID=857566 RepID=A0A1E3PH27_9ASCO|nr:hypothetical protein NADFUDRAFT_83788 [Nadsonia fulvescens var. elongata DSM 6958]
MAALSISPQGRGFFGIASSAVLLRALRVKNSDLSIIPPSQFSSETLPLIARNPAPKHIVDTLVDAYFTFYHTSYPFIHEATFRAQYNKLLPRPKEEVWQILFNTVLALGSWCINHENSSADLIFYHNAKSYMNSYMFESGSLPMVQALTLLSNYAQKRDKPNSGWNYLGLAVRMALGLGLHREFSSWKSSPLKQEMRRRLWWGLYIFDAGAAVTFGRPINLPSRNIADIKEVLNVPDNHLTIESESLPPAVAGPTIYSGLIAQTQFALASNEIYNRLISKPSPTAEEVLYLDKRIDEFINKLPIYFQEEHQDDNGPHWLVFTQYKLGWRYRNLRIILFRPFILQRILSEGEKPMPMNMNGTAEKECRRACLKNAHDTITSVERFVLNQERSIISVWYALYFLFQASLIPLICICSEPDSEHAREWLNDIERTKEILEILATKNRLAYRFLEVINRIKEQYMKTDNAGDPLVSKNEWLTDIYSLMYDDNDIFSGMSADMAVPLEFYGAS